MPVICPAILAADKDTYNKEVEKVAAFAHRVQIDLTDGGFASPKTIDAQDAWWPVGFKADFHLMFKKPLPPAEKILEHQPNLIIIHAEADGDFNQAVTLCKKHQVKLGVALLPDTPAEAIFSELGQIDHVLIFSGDLGKYGGTANLGLLDKVKNLKAKKPALEVGWDGGISDQNVAQLVFGGVDVLNVGGFIQNADDPAKAFASLQRIAEETGTT